MPTLSTTTTPNTITAGLIRAYANAQIAEGYGEDETPVAILTAIQQSESSEETCHLGRALLARHAALADPAYRLDGEMCDPRLVEIAGRLGYVA